MSSLADRYERIYPDTGLPEAQKEDRMQRLDFKSERHSLRRTGRTRGIVVPPLPWIEKEAPDGDS
jgi:hypothetical protein